MKKRKVQGTNLTPDQFKKLGEADEKRQKKLWLNLEKRTEEEKDELREQLTARDRLMRRAYTNIIVTDIPDDLGQIPVKHRTLMDYEKDEIQDIFKQMGTLGESDDKYGEYNKQMRALAKIAKRLCVDEAIREMIEEGVFTDDIIQAIVINAMMGTTQFMMEGVGSFRAEPTRAVLPRADGDSPEADS